MLFSQLLSQLSEVKAAGGLDGISHHLAADPELSAAAALDQAQAGQVSFLEPGNALAAALAASGASAVLLPAKGDEAEVIQRQASDRGVAWIALKDPRLAFAETLDALYPRKPKTPGIHASAVVAPEAVVGMGSHVGAHVVIGADVQIGSSCTIHPNVVIYDDVQIGDGCELHAGAV
ncbi:MAG: LpxD N-terminal domain-containing protein, partial [Vulcanococcus sp.]